MAKLKILMVESDDMLRDLIGKKFEKVGFDFIGLKDFPEHFIERVILEKPDLISLSMLYPGKKSGLDVLGEIKWDYRVANIPVFMLTNFTDPKYIKEAKTLGIVDWLVTAEHSPSEIIEMYSKYLDKIEKPSHVFYYKCMCKLEFSVFSWKKDWDAKFKPFCPECGSQQVNFLEKHDSKKQICQLKTDVLSL